MHHWQQHAWQGKDLADDAAAMKVQKLSVTPHKPLRQQSGNPFAEPAESRPAALQQPMQDPAPALPLCHHRSAPSQQGAVSPQQVVHHQAPPATKHQSRAKAMHEAGSRTPGTVTHHQSPQDHHQSPRDHHAQLHAGHMGAAVQHSILSSSQTADCKQSSSPGRARVKLSEAVEKCAERQQGQAPPRGLQCKELESQAVAADQAACLEELQVLCLSIQKCPIQKSPVMLALLSTVMLPCLGANWNGMVYTWCIDAVKMLQERLGLARDGSSSSEWELQMLQCQLTQAEQALHAERERSGQLQGQVQASQGCVKQAQLELQRVQQRAERLGKLVSQAEQQRKG